ncbi:MAG: flagellar hook-length control protein FliK, partial [Hyphomicrobiales bacterium]
TLPTPAVVALPPKQSKEDAPKAAEPAAPAEPKPATPADKPVARDTQPAERNDAEPKLRDRGFAAHLTETRTEKLADQVQQTTQQPQAATAPVKSDMGVITPKAINAAYQAPTQPLNMPQVAFEVVRQFNQGASRFLIRLDPPELGRIDVRMQVDSDGNLHARMTVERAETLDLMQRDQRSLEKALAQAGLDSSKTNLEFSLKQNPFARDGQNQQQGGQQSPFARDPLSGADEAPEIASTTTQYRGMASASGVNMFV